MRGIGLLAGIAVLAVLIWWWTDRPPPAVPSSRATPAAEADPVLLRGSTTPDEDAPDLPIPVSEHVRVFGRVVDEKSEKPIEGAKVRAWVKGAKHEPGPFNALNAATRWDTKTNDEGQYELVVPRARWTPSLGLSIRAKALKALLEKSFRPLRFEPRGGAGPTGYPDALTDSQRDEIEALYKDAR